MAIIAHVLEDWNNAGTERYVSNLVAENVKQGNEIKLYVLGNINDNKTINNLPGDIYRLSKYKFLFSVFKNFIKRENSISLYHVHLYSMLLPVVMCLKIFNCKTVITYHLPLSQWSLRHRVMWIISGYIANSCAVVSTAIKNEFSSYFKTTVIYPPVYINDTEVNHVNKNKKSINIVCVGRLDNKQKDWNTLIKAIALIPESYLIGINVNILGDGGDKNTILKCIKNNNLDDKVFLHGHKSEEEVIKNLKMADISILPSRYEGFGMSAVEAMIYGALTITSNYPASKDYIINGVTGFSFPVGDEVALSRLIINYINNREKGRSIAINGQKAAKKMFDAKKCSMEYQLLYNSIL